MMCTAKAVPTAPHYRLNGSSMVSRQESKQRQKRQKDALLRYQKERYKNSFARPGIHPFVLVLDHLKAGFNVPKIFRSAESFGAQAVHLVNIAPFDPAPAMGAFRKVPACFHDTFDAAYRQLSAQDYHLFMLDARAQTPLYDAVLPEKSAFIMGNEGLGHSFDPADYPAIQGLAIPQFGNTESLNVSVAASIVMYEYVRQHHQG